MMKKRLDYLDMTKGLGIFLVVLGHIEFIKESTLRFIFSFHMPLFFVVAGILAFEKRTEASSIPQEIQKKARGSLIPYVSFSLILLSMSVTGYFLQPGSITKEALLRQFLDVFTGYGIHILWFLPVYFLTCSSFFLKTKLLGTGKRNGVLLLKTLLALFLVRRFALTSYVTWEASYGSFFLWNIGIVLLRAALAEPFLLIGWYLAKMYRILSPAWEKLLSLCWIPGILLARKLSIFDLHYLYVEPIHYLSAMLSCVGIISLMKVLPVLKGLCFLGRNSLVIMCTHASFYVIYYVSLGLFFIRKFLPMPDPVFNLVTAILVCVMELPLIFIFQRCFPYLLGKKEKAREY